MFFYLKLFHSPWTSAWLVEPKNTSQHSKTKNEKILGRASCWTFHMFARASCKVKHITEASFKLLLLRRQVKQQISHTEHLERTTTIFFCKPQKKKKIPYELVPIQKWICWHAIKKNSLGSHNQTCTIFNKSWIHYIEIKLSFIWQC